MTSTMTRGPVVDERARGWLSQAEPAVRETWHACRAVADAQVGPVGLAAGDRPLADVEVMAGAMGACEYALAVRLHEASVAGAVPFPGGGGVLRARGWSAGAARRLARCGALVDRIPQLAGPWAAGVITSEHLDPIARVSERFTDEELGAIARELQQQWGQWPPGLVGRFVVAADRMLHPPADPTPAEADAHASRALSFSITAGTVLLAGELPRLEGELVIAAIDALAERLRSSADHVPAAARRADALVQLVNDAHAADLLPARGGLPVALTVTLERSELGDPSWTTGRGHLLTTAEVRWATCDAAITPVLVQARDDGRPADLAGHGQADLADGQPEVGPPPQAARIAALAAAMFDTRLPLAVGRTQRTATTAQRRALALRDGGCIIPGCGVPAEACQVHHLTEWAAGGTTDLDGLVLLCWAHHRQVDLRMWTIEPGPPGGREPPGDSPPGTPWPASNRAPFTVSRTPRHRGRT